MLNKKVMSHTILSTKTRMLTRFKAVCLVHYPGGATKLFCHPGVIGAGLGVVPCRRHAVAGVVMTRVPRAAHHHLLRGGKVPLFAQPIISVPCVFTASCGLC